MMAIVIFVFGLIVGSFLNALIHRLHTGQSILEASSRCPHCQHKLKAVDLIPLVSFFILRRRCRYCQKQISWQYPVVELVTAGLFVLVAVRIPDLVSSFHFWFQLVFISFLIVIFVYDLKHYLVLDRLVVPAAVLALIYQFLNHHILAALYGILFLAGFFLALYLVSRGKWIGFGDVKLAVFLGALVPWPVTLVTFFLAYLIGALVGAALVILGKKKMSGRLPFGTFLTLAAFIGMMWGETMVNWYFDLIGF